MKKQVGTFAVEEVFQITGRGWVLAGELNGEVSVGNQLVFDRGVQLFVNGFEMIQTRTFPEKSAVLISNQFASRQELTDLKIIGATAQILE